MLVPGRRSLEESPHYHEHGEEGSFEKSGGKKEEWVRTTMSPQVMATRQSLERERVKDRLRSFLSGRGRQEIERRVREQRAKEREGVRVLARRFAGREKSDGDGSRWGRDRRGNARPERPARAHVLGLRRFWENMGGTTV